MPQPTVETAIFDDLDVFLTQVEVMEKSLGRMRVRVDRSWSFTRDLDEAYIDDPFKAQLQVTGSLALAFLMPADYSLQFSGTKLAAPAEVYRETAEGILVPTGSVVELDEENPMYGRSVRAILDEDRLSMESQAAMRNKARELVSPIRTEVVGEVINGECLIAPLRMLTETNRSSYYNLQIVPRSPIA